MTTQTDSASNESTCPELDDSATASPLFTLEGGDGEGLGDANDPSVGGAVASAAAGTIMAPTAL